MQIATFYERNLVGERRTVGDEGPSEEIEKSISDIVLMILLSANYKFSYNSHELRSLN